MYGVVVCPRCKRAKGVDLKRKTTACACGFEIRVVPSKIRARAQSARELAPLVGRASAELAGGLRAYEAASAPPRRTRPRDVHARVIAIAAKSRDRTSRVRAAAVELTKELEVFSPVDWAKVLDGLGIPASEEALQALVRSNVVYEPKPGFFRAVSFSL
jgi:hypothetical protein